MSVDLSPQRTEFLDRVTLWLATGLGAGWLPYAPGTFGTLWGLVIAWGLSVSGWAIAWQVIALAVLCLAGVPICTRAATLLKRKDPGPVVFDEYASIPLAFLSVDFSWTTAAYAFVIFRLLDITKPWPIRRLERLPNGWGIMADDIAAGLLTGGILRLAMIVAAT